jgi:iron complex outermembrane receptor protein
MKSKTLLLRIPAIWVIWGSILSPAQSLQSLPTIEIRRGPAGNPSLRRVPGGPPQKPAAAAQAKPIAQPPPVQPSGTGERPPAIEKFQIPNSVSSVTRAQIDRQVNVVDTEDALKYMPSLAVRKRFNGDTQAPLQTRTWSFNSPARSLVYVDDLLISNLMSNETLTGAPRWGVVSPEEIERIDFLYGPYSAQYPGNSMGGVLLITTRTPEKLEISVRNTTSVQDFSLYGTSRAFTTNATNFFIGDRVNDFAWSLSGNWLGGAQPPQIMVVAQPTNTYPYPGAFFALNRFGLPAQVLGSAGGLDGNQLSGRFKASYDLSRDVRATYSVGLWSNDGTSRPENYLTLGHVPYFGPSPLPSPPGLGPVAFLTFGSGYFRTQEKLLTNSAAIKSNSGGLFDFELSGSNFSVLQFDQISPFSAAYPYGGYTSNGKDLRFGGTYWSLLDLKGILRPSIDALKDHNLSFGLHGDQVHFSNPVYLTTNWPAGMFSSYGVTATRSSGTTRTQALWFQDAWSINPETKLTLGLRAETWKGSDGLTQTIGNLTSTGLPANLSLQRLAPSYQPVTSYARLSPKASFERALAQDWSIAGNIGVANRFPTPRELYGLNSAVTSGFDVIPNPTLRPEVALTKEIVFKHDRQGGGTIRASFFDEEVRDAMIAQTAPLAGTSQLSLTVKNVERVRNSGVELAINKDNFFLEGLELAASATWVKSRVISFPDWSPSVAWPRSLSELLRNPGNMDFWCYSVAGKNLPYVPEWKANLVATYRPDDQWSFTFGARYQSNMSTTFSNNDFVHNVYQSLDGFFVADVKARLKLDQSTALDFGIDNIGNYKYFIVNPMPQRTFYLALSHQIGGNSALTRTAP